MKEYITFISNNKEKNTIIKNSVLAMLTNSKNETKLDDFHLILSKEIYEF